MHICYIWCNLVILAQIQIQVTTQAKFHRILSQNGQNDLQGQGQWPPFSIPAESIPGYMFGANLVILTQICDESSHRQAKFPRILSQNDLEGHGQWPPFSIPAVSITGYMFDANLVIPTHICDELSHRHVKFPRILSQNGQNDLEGHNQWPRGFYHAHGHAHYAPMGKWQWRCTSTGQYSSIELDLEWIGSVVAEFWAPSQYKVRLIYVWRFPW